LIRNEGFLDLYRIYNPWEETIVISNRVMAIQRLEIDWFNVDLLASFQMRFEQQIYQSCVILVE